MDAGERDLFRDLRWVMCNGIAYGVGVEQVEDLHGLEEIQLTRHSCVAFEEVFWICLLYTSLRRRASVESFLDDAAILPWDSATARIYGQLRADQERKGRPLRIEDLMIAAHALSQGLTLVTHDQVFSFVDGLKTEDWTVA